MIIDRVPHSPLLRSLGSKRGHLGYRRTPKEERRFYATAVTLKSYASLAARRVPPSEALRINYVYLKTSGSPFGVRRFPLWGTTVPSQRVRSKRVPHSLGTVSTESAARRYYKAIVEFESTLQGHEACDLTVSPYRVYPFPPSLGIHYIVMYTGVRRFDRIPSLGT